MKKRLVLLAFVLCVPALWAADGVIEINQAAVEAGGGFPYVISEPGSYMLTGNLSVPGGDTTAIEVRADDVTLDLNGFAVGCGGLFDPDDPCDLGSGGEGVTAFFVRGENSDNASNTVVRNGTIRGMGFHGVNIDSGLVEGIQAQFNGGFGIRVGAGVVTDCLARNNGAKGIGIGKGVATTNIALSNGTDGIGVREGVRIVSGRVEGVRALENGETGISLGSGIVRGCLAESNGGFGINVTTSGTVEHSIALFNCTLFGIILVGGIVRGNASDSIFAQDSAILGNWIGTQLGLGVSSGYADNVVDGVVGFGFEDGFSEAQPIGCNLISGNLVCPEGSAAQGASGL